MGEGRAQSRLGALRSRSCRARVSTAATCLSSFGPCGADEAAPGFRNVPG
jgi:hypothetical protein